MVGGVKVIISREGIGEDGICKRDKGARVSSLPLSNLHFFDLAVSPTKAHSSNSSHKHTYPCHTWWPFLQNRRLENSTLIKKEEIRKKVKSNLLFSSQVIFFKKNVEGSSPR